jgi:hypothetical protein
MLSACRHFAVLASLAVVVLSAGCEAASQRPSSGGDAAAAELKVVKLADLNQAIAANRGKVVLVDIWGEF